MFIAVDIVLIKNAFLVSLMRSIKFNTVQDLANREKVTLLLVLDKIFTN